MGRRWRSLQTWRPLGHAGMNEAAAPPSLAPPPSADAPVVVVAGVWSSG